MRTMLSARPMRFAAVAFLALVGCARGQETMRVRVEPGPAPAPVRAPGPRTLREALASLDTTYAPRTDEGAGAAALMKAVREIRRGQMDEAVARLAPLAAAQDSVGALAREAIGQLLVHRGAWAVLAQSGGATGPLFRAYARAEPESWTFAEDSSVLPLELTSVGTPVVEVMVNGVPRRMWVDTGAGLTVVSSTLAGAAGIAAADSAGETGTSTTRTVAARPAVVGELRLGAITVRNHPAMILDAAALQFQLPRGGGTLAIDGIIGWPLIRQLDLTLDYAGRRLVARRPRPRAVEERNFFWLGYPTVAATTESGREVLFGLDTGANRTALSSLYLDAAGVRASGERQARYGGAGGFESETVRIVKSTSFFVDGARVRLEHASVRPPQAEGPLALVGVLGSDVAGMGSIRIDFLNGRFDFRPAAP
jgi:Aspartyl protease